MVDLLSPNPHENVGSLSIQDDAKGNVNVKGLTLTLANTEEEALNMVFEG
jgi:hypothetical protein